MLLIYGVHTSGQGITALPNKLRERHPRIIIPIKGGIVTFVMIGFNLQLLNGLQAGKVYPPKTPIASPPAAVESKTIINAATCSPIVNYDEATILVIVEFELVSFIQVYILFKIDNNIYLLWNSY